MITATRTTGGLARATIRITITAKLTHVEGRPSCWRTVTSTWYARDPSSHGAAPSPTIADGLQGQGPARHVRRRRFLSRRGDPPARRLRRRRLLHAPGLTRGDARRAAPRFVREPGRERPHRPPGLLLHPTPPMPASLPRNSASPSMSATSRRTSAGSSTTSWTSTPAAAPQTPAPAATTG